MFVSFFFVDNGARISYNNFYTEGHVMKIIAMTNKKGGVGKTTTALCVAACLGRRGVSVLAIDMDAQGNFSQASGAKRETTGTFDFLNGSPPQSCIQKTKWYDLIAADARLSRAEKEFGQPGNELILRKALTRVKDYDYIILDTSPSMNVLTLNAFTAADAAVVCCQPDVFSLSGLDDLMKNINFSKAYYNKSLSVAGILLTRYESRTSIRGRTAEMFKERAKELDTQVFSTVIRESVAIKEAQMRQCDIFEYSATCHAADDYQSFTKELYLALGGDKKKWPKHFPEPSADDSPRISIPRQPRKRTTTMRRR